MNKCALSSQQFRNAVVSGVDMFILGKEHARAARLIADAICDSPGSVDDGCAAASAPASAAAAGAAANGDCIPPERIDEAVRRILMAKARLGLLEVPSPLTKGCPAIGAAAAAAAAEVPSAAWVSDPQDPRKKRHRFIARAVAERSQVRSVTAGD
jgi:beta-glucosidase-like glycosyl hydrolase